MDKIKQIKKYIDLENLTKQNLDLCHVLILEILLNEPTKWFNHSHFEPYLKRYQYSKSVIALSGNIKKSLSTVRIFEKNLFWVDKRKSAFDGRMNEIKISEKGLNDLQ